MRQHTPTPAAHATPAADARAITSRVIDSPTAGWDRARHEYATGHNHRGHTHRFAALTTGRQPLGAPTNRLDGLIGVLYTGEDRASALSAYGMGWGSQLSAAS